MESHHPNFQVWKLLKVELLNANKRVHLLAPAVKKKKKETHTNEKIVFSLPCIPSFHKKRKFTKLYL